MAAYFIIDMQDAARFETYQQLVPATVAQYGGRYLVRGGQHEVLEGALAPDPPRRAGVPEWGGGETVVRVGGVPEDQAAPPPANPQRYGPRGGQLGARRIETCCARILAAR